MSDQSLTLTVSSQTSNIAVIIQQATEQQIEELTPFYVAYINQSLWEADGTTTIRPDNSKTVNAVHLSGELTGGIFQP